MKNYIANLIPKSVYGTWLSGKKVVISAPTGTGKTTFILSELLPYCKERGKNLLVLCNRRLLSEQYKFDLADRYFRYAEMEEDLDVWTYQETAEHVKTCSNIKWLFEGYDVVVCDEVHYFYSDADFNSFGTYVLLQAVVLAAFYKTMVMITATLDEVLPLLRTTFSECQRKLENTEGRFESFYKYCFADDIYNFQHLAEYEHFQCFYTPDVETLAEVIGKSEKKTLIFIDDKSKAEKFKTLLVGIGKMSSEEIYLLNSRVMDEQSDDEVIVTLCGANKLLPKVLITTSVLDNGVSIHDSDVGNLVIATESRVSFVQMIGRIRNENCVSCNLYIYPRETKYYKKRVDQYEKKMEYFQELSGVPLVTREFDILTSGWYGNDEYAEFLRNAVVLTKNTWEFYGAEPAYAALKRGELMLAVNEFAKEKTGNLLNAERSFYRLALDSLQKVAEKQMSWIKKAPEELQIIASTYIEKRKAELIAELLSVQNYTSDELKNKKSELSKAYRKDFFSEFVAKDGGFSTEKLRKICAKYDLKLTQIVGKDKNQRYSIDKIDTLEF